MGIIRKLCNWYFSRKALPYWCILALDCSIVFLSGHVVYYIMHGGAELANIFWKLSYSLIYCDVVFIVFFFVFHTFKGILRYSSFIDLYKVACSTLFAATTIGIIRFVHVRIGILPGVFVPSYMGLLLAFAFSTLLMWAVRVLVKILHDTYRAVDSPRSVFVYGCLTGGISLARSVANSVDRQYSLAGFVSGDPDLAGSWLLGAEVFYDNDEVVQHMIDKGASVLFVSPMQSERFTNRTALIDALINANIKIMMMPPFEEWDVKSDLSHHLLREVQIEDLLPRKKIEVDMKAIGAMLTGKRILITGAAGSIGAEMARQVAKFTPSEFILIDQAETPMHDMRLWMDNFFKAQPGETTATRVHTIVSSITDAEHMEKIFAEYRPEYVFHAAAYKHVPMMEDNPGQAVRNNVYGTRVIADLAVKYGTKKFVMISTDKAVNPTNVMGCSKRICEIYCQALNAHLRKQAPAAEEGGGEITKFITTRFGNVLGSNGSVIPIFRQQICEGGPIKVTHPDIIRYFMLIPEACRLVLEAGTMGNGGEIYVFDMGAPVKIVDLAHRMIALSGAKDIKIEFTGLRDGEKLYEELLATKENTLPTPHPKIMVARARQVAYEDALRDEEELYALSQSFDDMAIVRKMKEIVPEYKSQHSKYEILDKDGSED